MGVIHDAVHLEEKAERSYRDAARRVQDPGARRLLGLFADAEAGHAALLREFGHVDDLESPDLVTAATAWVRGAVEGGAVALSEDVQILDIMRHAMDIERETEVFYRHHAEHASDVRVGEVLGQLAGIEHGHYELLGSLVEYYNRPREWVESAEFGLRPDY